MNDWAFEAGQERCGTGQVPKASPGSVISNCNIQPTPEPIQEPDSPELPLPPPVVLCPKITFNSELREGPTDIDIQSTENIDIITGQICYDFNLILTLPDGPGNPGNPGNPGDPSDPSDPSDPDDPVDPGEPIGPSPQLVSQVFVPIFT